RTDAPTVHLVTITAALSSRLGRRSRYVQTLKLRHYLDQTGWVRSKVEAAPQFADGRPRAWLAMPALELLEERVPAATRVFEWGSGASTDWWTEVLACDVTSVEHDPEWAAKRPHVIHRPLGDGYVEEIGRH